MRCSHLVSIDSYLFMRNCLSLPAQHSCHGICQRSPPNDIHTSYILLKDKRLGIPVSEEGKLFMTRSKVDLFFLRLRRLLGLAGGTSLRRRDRVLAPLVLLVRGVGKVDAALTRRRRWDGGKTGSVPNLVGLYMSLYVLFKRRSISVRGRRGGGWDVSDKDVVVSGHG